MVVLARMASGAVKRSLEQEHYPCLTEPPTRISIPPNTMLSPELETKSCFSAAFLSDILDLPQHELPDAAESPSSHCNRLMEEMCPFVFCVDCTGDRLHPNKATCSRLCGERSDQHADHRRCAPCFWCMCSLPGQPS